MKFKSHIITQASGSQGGTTYAHNQGGMYMRARSIPTNPNSGFQSTVRGLFRTLMNVWTNTLTAVQRAAWKTYATNVPLINTLGDAKKINDNAMFERCNLPRVQNGLARVDAAPTTFDLGTFTMPTFTVHAGTTCMTATFTVGDAWNATGGGMIISASRPQNPSINYPPTDTRVVGIISGTATSPQTFVLPFPAGTTATSMFLFVSATQPDGRLSTQSNVKSTPV